MNYKDKISVVTVVYNGVDELEKTIGTVISQSYTDIEYIVVDGASTDGTIDLIKRYEDYISYWISEPDKGVYDAMNKGLERVTGDWVVFMNAGDFFYSSNTISDIFAANKDYSEYAVVYGNTEFRLKHTNFVLKALDTKSGRIMPFSHQAAFTRTEIAKKYKYNAKYKLVADIDFFLRLEKDGLQFKRIPVTVCSYDAQKGLSMERSSEVVRVKEYIDMLIENYQIPRNSTFLKKMLRKAYMKQFVRYILPNSVWMAIREKRIIKEGNPD